MISKQLSTMFSFHGLLSNPKKINLISKYLLSRNICHPKTIQCLYVDKQCINNSISRQSHVNAVKKEYQFSDNAFAHQFMELSEDYSNTVVPALSLDQDLKVEEMENILQKQWIGMNSSEILQNFEHLSIYAAKNDESINDSKYNGILEVLISKLPDFSDQEIHHLFRCLELWKIEKTGDIYRSLLTALDKKCLSRLYEWHLEQILLINDHFFKLRMARFVEFTWQSLKKLGLKCRKMSPANLVHYAFFMKVNRSLPIRIYEIEYRLEKYFDNYSIEELSIIGMAFAKYEAIIRSPQLLSKIIQKLQAEIDNVNNISLKNVLEFIRYKADPEIRNQLITLLKTLTNHISRFNVQTLAKIMKFQTKIVMINEELTSKILERCEKEIKNMKLHDLEQVLFALHVFNYDPKTTKFYSLMYNELIDPNRAGTIDSSPNLLVNISNYMVKQQFCPEEILKRVLSQDFIEKVYDSNFYKLNTRYLDLDYCIELDHPEYNGPRATKDSLNFLMKFYGVLKKRTKISLSERILNEVADTMKKITNSETAVHIDAVLPHVRKTQIILCYDSETKEYLSPSEKMDNMPLGTIKYAPDDGKKWYAIMFAAKNLITRDDSHRFTGAIATEIRQLKNIGYYPIVISGFEWENLVKNACKIEYLEGLLR